MSETKKRSVRGDVSEAERDRGTLSVFETERSLDEVSDDGSRFRLLASRSGIGYFRLVLLYEMGIDASLSGWRDQAYFPLFPRDRARRRGGPKPR